MTGKALGCSFYGNAFYAPRPISKNREVPAAVACVNYKQKVFFFACLRAGNGRI